MTHDEWQHEIIAAALAVRAAYRQMVDAPGQGHRAAWIEAEAHLDWLIYDCVDIKEQP